MSSPHSIAIGRYLARIGEKPFVSRDYVFIKNFRNFRKTKWMVNSLSAHYSGKAYTVVLLTGRNTELLTNAFACEACR